MSVLKWSEWLKAADEGGFSSIPAGEYDLYIDSAAAAQSSSGKDMIKLTFKVESGPHEGAKVFTNFVVSPESPAALSFLIRKLAALGLDREYLSRNPTLEKIAEDLEKRRCTAKVTVREFNGSERNDVDMLKPPADGKTHRVTQHVPDSPMGVFVLPDNAFTPSRGSAPELPF